MDDTHLTHRFRSAVMLVVLSMAFSVACDDRAATDGIDPAVVDSLRQRVQQGEDEKQIRDLLVRYGRHLDTLDFAAYSQLFARDGEWSGLLSEYTTIKGPEAIRAAMEKAFAERTYDAEYITNVHLVSNVAIEVDGDRATGYSKWTVLSRSEDGTPYVRVSGHYADTYVRQDGQWKFLSRIARREMP